MSPSFVGVDVGGTKVAPARWSPDEGFVAGERIPTDASSWSCTAA